MQNHFFRRAALIPLLIAAILCSAFTIQPDERLESRALGNAKIKIVIGFDLPKQVAVSFNANGGTCPINGKTVYKGRTFGALPVAKRTGYNFTGWFSAKSGGTKIAAESTVTISKDKTYYAHWTKTEPMGPPRPPANVVKININLASHSELQNITGVGPKLADSIIAFRKANGGFRDIAELKKVKGIGTKSFERMKDEVKL
jgi:competence ComEA-like helix-hairpin-helix protein